MADRIFGTLALLVTLAYGYIAFTAISAPFQYDPLGPESWPQILSVCAALCCLYIIVRPDEERFDVNRPTWVIIALVFIALVFYAALFEPMGFMLSTALFSAVTARLLGSKTLPAIVFGLGLGVIGYFVCDQLLALNLPDGLLRMVF